MSYKTSMEELLWISCCEISREYAGSFGVNGWEVVYKKAEHPDGALLFPEKLDKKRLQEMRALLGARLYASYYLNEVIPNE